MADPNDPFMRNKDASVQARAKAQNRANVLQLKLMGQGHPTGLTHNLLKLFEPRPPLEYKPPPEKRKPLPYSGMAQFVSHFAEPGEPEYSPPVVYGETKAEKKARINKLRLEKGAEKAAEELLKYDPSKDPNISGDPYKTLFVAKLSYETTEHKIKREFEAYGAIKRVRLITDKDTNKPRGYAFIEYMHTRDMKTAYKQGDGRKVDNRRLLVDVERGRTVPNWRPRRLGGGLGSTRIGGEEVNQKHSGREQPQVASGPSRSEEPRVREDRHHDREKSHERKEREPVKDKYRERGHDRTRSSDPREDKHRHHHRDRDKDRDRERETGNDQDRVRSRDKERDRGRDHDRERGRDRDRDHDRRKREDRGRDYDRPSREKDRGHRHGRDAEYDQVEDEHYKERPAVREDFEHDGHDYGQERYNEPVKHGRKRDYDHYEQSQDQEPYEHLQPHEREKSDRNGERSKRHEPEHYNRDHDSNSHDHQFQSRPSHADPEPLEEGEAVDEGDLGYQRSNRSLSPQ